MPVVREIEFIPQDDAWYVVQARNMSGEWQTVWSYPCLEDAEAHICRSHCRIDGDFKPLLRIVFCLAPKDRYYGSPKGAGLLCRTKEVPRENISPASEEVLLSYWL